MENLNLYLRVDSIGTSGSEEDLAFRERGV